MEISELEIYIYIMQVYGKPERPISDALEGNAHEYAKHKLQLKYGKARQYLCYDCERSANKWCYVLDDPGEFRNERGVRFSLNPDKYVPRCNSCFYDFTSNMNNGQILKQETCTHRYHVPNMYVDEYEFVFCRKCCYYRRRPKESNYAWRSQPTLSIVPQSLPEL